MKLTIEHLALCMAHGIKVQYYDDERGRMTSCRIVELRDGEMTIADNEYQWEVEFYEIMPLLKPMSDLRNDSELTASLGLFTSADVDYTIEFTLNLGYKDLCKLIANKYDVFGLLDCKCAFTLTPNPNSCLNYNIMKTELLTIPIGSNDYREHQFGYTRTVIRFKKGKRIVKSFFSFKFNKNR